MSTGGGSMGTDLCCRVHAQAGDCYYRAPTYYLYKCLKNKVEFARGPNSKRRYGLDKNRRCSELDGNADLCTDPCI